MPRKTKIIFIVTFVFVGIIILGFYLFNKNKNSNGTEDTTSLYQRFNPFGTSSNSNNTGGNNTEPTVENKNNKNAVRQTSRLHKLTDFAVAGATFFEEQKILTDDQDQIIPSLKYTERATGHIYQMNLNTKSIGRISNSTIPSVYETIFDGKASSIIYRYASSDNKSITSFLATLGGKSSFLATDILQVSLSPDKNRFFSIIKNKTGVIGVINSFDDTKTKQVFTSAFSEWLPQWVTEQNIYLTTKPSYLIEGSVFNLDTSNGTLSKLFGGINGLTTLANKDGTIVLFGASLDKGPTLNVFNIKEHTSTNIGKYGIPEKCVWSNDNINVYCAIPSVIQGTQYPDYWYQGLISFDDMFIKINTNTKEASTLTNVGVSEPIDGINLFLSKTEDKLFFINKKDYTLWQLDL